jgi:hypothetical protein
MLQSRHFKRKDVLIAFAHVLQEMAVVKGRAAQTDSIHLGIALHRPAAVNRGGLLDQYATPTLMRQHGDVPVYANEGTRERLRSRGRSW